MQAAARLLRERGSAGISVQDVMAAAGLTHGGFYKHFASKDELMAIAAESAYEGMLAELAALATQPDKTAARDELIGDYLSTRHRDAPGTGCPNTALAVEAAQADGRSPLRKAYTDGLRRTLDALTELEDGPEARTRAILDLATMVGALSLARAAGRTALSKEILETVRDAL